MIWEKEESEMWSVVGQGLWRAYANNDYTLLSSAKRCKNIDTRAINVCQAASKRRRIITSHGNRIAMQISNDSQRSLDSVMLLSFVLNSLQLTILLWIYIATQAAIYSRNSTILIEKISLDSIDYVEE